MRIDKYLWTVRLSKTRSLASRLCNAEKVKLNGQFVKSAKTISIDDVIAIKHQPIWRTYTILGLPKSRLGAKLVEEYLKETTAPEDLLILEEITKSNRENRLLGFSGRPTKKDRRNWERFNK